MDEYLQNWLIKADHDLKAAEHELNHPPQEIITDAICFHCQQAVVKPLKVYLISWAIEFGKTHTL